jgi:tRNA (cytidine/uridine-2'-O-)-methyltransferase
MKVILFEPEIPQNTGNIIRTCKATRSSLALVKPISFSLADRHMKRAGLDYGDDFPIELLESLPPYLEEAKTPFFFFSSKAERPYTEANFSEESVLIFGSETRGLPPFYKTRWEDRFYTIPMIEGHRSLNLSNAVAIVLYEALRQNNFKSVWQSSL